MTGDVEVPRFGPLLATARRMAGVATQREMAARCGIDRLAYHRLETGDRSRNPGWDVVYRLLVGGSLPLEAFFPERTVLDAARRLVARRRDNGRPTCP